VGATHSTADPEKRILNRVGDKVELNDKHGFMDKTGKEIVPPKYDYDIFYSSYFYEGLARVELNGKDFYIKIFPDGKVVEYYDE
jgi:hypothetical protein